MSVQTRKSILYFVIIGKFLISALGCKRTPYLTKKKEGYRKVGVPKSTALYHNM